MAFTTADLAAVDQAIATGELSVEVNGRRITYRSVADLERARTLIKAELAAPSAGSPNRRGSYRVQFATHRGD